MKVYGHPLSTCTRKVLAVLAEKGAPADLQVVDFAKGEHKLPAHLAFQPFGQLPAIEDDGFVLYESRAIMRYLDEKLDGASLTPKDPKQRALMEQWISVETSNFTPTAMKIIYQRVFHPMFGKAVDEEVVSAARTELAKTIAIMETQLGKTPYLVGDAPTLADIAFLPYVEYLFAGNSGDVITGSPNVARWWTAMSNRPAWKTATGKNLSFVRARRRRPVGRGRRDRGGEALSRSPCHGREPHRGAKHASRSRAQEWHGKRTESRRHELRRQPKCTRERDPSTRARLARHLREGREHQQHAHRGGREDQRPLCQGEAEDLLDVGQRSERIGTAPRQRREQRGGRPGQPSKPRARRVEQQERRERDRQRARLLGVRLRQVRRLQHHHERQRDAQAGHLAMTARPCERDREPGGHRHRHVHAQGPERQPSMDTVEAVLRERSDHQHGREHGERQRHTVAQPRWGARGEADDRAAQRDRDCVRREGRAGHARAVRHQRAHERGRDQRRDERERRQARER